MAPAAPPVGMAPPPKPRILLMGMRRCGKSSIQKVVFHKMSPHETLFLEGTSKIVKTDINNSAFLRFEVWDLPPPTLADFTEQAAKWTPVFSGCSSLVWVIDVQDDYAESIARLQAALVVASRCNPNVQCEVFVHKADALGEEGRWEAQRDVHEQMTQELSNCRLTVPLRVFLTSIYDHSVFEAFSKVVQKLLPQLPTLQNLLDRFLTKCSGEKAFLFDMVSKLYLATDSSPVDMQLYELCSDVIDVVIDVSYIYGPKDPASKQFESASAPAADVDEIEGGYVVQLNHIENKWCSARECGRALLRKHPFVKRISVAVASRGHVHRSRHAHVRPHAREAGARRVQLPTLP